MPSWRFRRSATRSLPEAASPSLGQPRGDDNTNLPPRYSNLTSLAESQATPSHSSVASPDSSSNAEHTSSRFSMASWSSQLSSPSYVTNDPETRSISSSTVTLTNPPRYSVLSQNSRAARDGANVGGQPVSTSEYAFDILGGFKSERWATLRLYDEKYSAHRGSRKKRHPRFSNMDTVLGSVEMHLSSPQTIRNIELTLKGSIITGALEDGGSTKFLEQGYTIWDRKFGDPRPLAHDHVQVSSKYGGELSGSWIFPFSIPFPTHVDLSTLRAVYPREGEGPVRFLPEPLHDGSLLAPFDLGDDPTGVQPSSHSTLVHPSNITPFDVRTPHMHTEKGMPVSSPTASDTPTQASRPSFGPISPPSRVAPSIPSLEPYTHRHSEDSNPPSPSDHATKFGRPPLRLVSTGSRRGRPRGATSMQGPDLSVSTTSHPLPQSFLERDIMVNVQYEMTLTVTHGRFSTKSRASTPILYAPVTAPPQSMTPGRHRAYRQREIPPSPVLDPDGWKRLPPVSIRGTFNDQTTLTVNYALSLATPFSYARLIPCCLTISCDDVSALNLFADPRTPCVRLRRSTRFLYNQAELTRQVVGPSWEDGSACSLGGNVAPGRPRLSRTPLMLAQRKKDNRMSDQPIGQSSTGIEPFIPTVQGKVEEETLGSSDEGDGQNIGDAAVWCTPTQFAQEPRVRRLYGEIRLPRELQPTCKFPLFNILYHVELLAPATNAFVPDMAQSKPSPRNVNSKAKATASETEKETERAYISQSVDITTNPRRDEPTPVPFVGFTN